VEPAGVPLPAPLCLRQGGCGNFTDRGVLREGEVPSRQTPLLRAARPRRGVRGCTEGEQLQERRLTRTDAETIVKAYVVLHDFGRNTVVIVHFCTV
jgi:hypothetical protein